MSENITEANANATPSRGAPSRPAEPGEVELVASLLARDNRAWQTFVARYRGLIISMIRNTLARFTYYHHIEVDDVYGAVMSSLVANDMQKLRAFDVKRGVKLGTWVGLIAGHLTWDFLRDAKRRYALLDAARRNIEQRFECDVAQVAISRQTCLKLLELRDGLSPTDRRFFDLFYVQCAGPEEIASELRISIKTVYTKNHKVRSKLQLGLDCATARESRRSRRKPRASSHVAYACDLTSQSE